MDSKRDKLKEEIMAALDQQVEAMLDRLDESSEVDMESIEDMALEARQAMGREITQQLVEASSETPVPGPRCPSCQGEMHYKGRKKRRVVTRSGEVTIKRAYFYCTPCKQGLFPPGSRLEVGSE